MGSFHKWCEELRKSLIAACRENVHRTWHFYNDAIDHQKMSARWDEEIMMEKKLEKAQEDFIVVLYFHEQYELPHYWNTVAVARQKFAKIKSQVVNCVL
jgi:hypothetical protein